MAHRETAFRPADFFDHPARALPPASSADDLYTALQDGSFVAALPKPPPGRANQAFYRGQRDASWGIQSSLYRQLHWGRNPFPSESVLSYAEQEVLRVMRRHQGLGLNMTDGQLLSVLQHHGVPTRLVDFSTGAHEALFFAVDSEDGTDGRLFFVQPPASYSDSFWSFTPYDEEETCTMPGGFVPPPVMEQAPFWRDAPTFEWRAQVHAISDPSLDARMQAQKGIFLAGGLPIRYAGLSGPVHDGEQLSLNDTATLSNLALVWPKKGPGRLHMKERWAAWSTVIPARWKPRLRALLNKNHGISQRSMYPRLHEAGDLGVYLARNFNAPEAARS